MDATYVLHLRRIANALNSPPFLADVDMMNELLGLQL
jgi:hypothetical protein